MHHMHGDTPPSYISETHFPPKIHFISGILYRLSAKHSMRHSEIPHGKFWHGIGVWISTNWHQQPHQFASTLNMF